MSTVATAANLSLWRIEVTLSFFEVGNLIGDGPKKANFNL